MVQNDILSVTDTKEYKLINIKESCFFLDYAKLEDDMKLPNNIPTRLFVREGSSFLSSRLVPQKIYTFT